MNRKTVWSIVLATLIVCLFVPLANAGGKNLDGKTYQVDLMTPDGEKQPDTLSFAAGQLDSAACHAYGFGKSPYTVMKDGSAMKFTSTAKNKDGGKNAWEGMINGDKISGTLTSTDPKGAVTRYTFEGKPKA